MLRCPHEPQNSYIAKETKAALGLCLFGLWPDSFPERRLTARPLCESGILRQNLPAYTRKHTGGEIVSDLQRRTEVLLRERGYLVASVEKRKTFPAKGKKRCAACGQVPLISVSVDLWNVFDLIAVRPPRAKEIIFVQVTSSANHAARRNKILASAEAKLCLLSGANILIQSWRKKENRWQCADEWMSFDQFAVGLADTVEQYYEDQARLKLLKRGEAGRPVRHLPILDQDTPF